MNKLVDNIDFFNSNLTSASNFNFENILFKFKGQIATQWDKMIDIL